MSSEQAQGEPQNKRISQQPCVSPDHQLFHPDQVEQPAHPEVAQGQQVEHAPLRAGEVEVVETQEPKGKGVDISVRQCRL